jgi:WD40 repeat protein
VGSDKVVLLDLPGGSYLTSIPMAAAREVSIAANGRYAATVTREGEVAVWSLAHDPAQRIDGGLPRVRSWRRPLFASDGSWLAIVTAQDELRVVPVSENGTGKDRAISTGAVRELAASSDGKLLAVNDEKTVVVHDIPGQSQVLSVPIPQWQGQGRAAVSFRSRSHQLLILYDEQPSSTAEAFAMVLANRRRLAIWDVDHRRRSRVDRMGGGAGDPFAFSRDGAKLIVGGNAAEVVDLDRGGEPHLEMNYSIRPNSLSYSDDGRSVFTLSSKGTAHLWAVPSGLEIDRLPASDLAAGALVGNYAITVARSGEIRRWLFQPEALINAGCARFARAERPAACRAASAQSRQ